MFEHYFSVLLINVSLENSEDVSLKNGEDVSSTVKTVPVFY